MEKITIITICYNEEKTIEATMCSVLKQTYKNLEYLVIDGKSDDSTYKIALKVADEFKERDVTIYTEEDFGIYNAMNRGISRAKGEYIIFMNAGDCFHNLHVLEKIGSCIKKKGKAIYYGKAWYIPHNNERGAYCFELGSDDRNYAKVFMTGKMPCHQSIVAPIESLREHYFNEHFKIRADFEWILTCYKAGYTLVDTGIMISDFSVGTGICSKLSQKNKLLKETREILLKHFPIRYRLFLWMEKLKMLGIK